MVNRKYTFLSVKIVLTVLFVWVVWHKIDLNILGEVIKNANYLYLLIAFVLFLLAHAVNTIKWRQILLVLGSKQSFRKLFHLNALGIYYATFLPGGQLTGQTIKAIRAFSSIEGKGNVVFSVFYDKVLGVVAFIILGFLAIFYTDTIFNFRLGIESFFITALVISLLFFALFIPKVFRIADFLITQLTSIFPRIVNKKYVELVQSSRIFLDDPRKNYFPLLSSFVFQILNSSSVYLLLLSYGASVSIVDVIWVHAIVSLILFLPLSVAGLGQREVSFIYLLSLLGISSDMATSMSLTLFIFAIIYGVYGEIIEVISRRKRAVTN